MGDLSRLLSSQGAHQRRAGTLMSPRAAATGVGSAPLCVCTVHGPLCTVRARYVTRGPPASGRGGGGGGHVLSCVYFGPGNRYPAAERRRGGDGP